jgi:hypothetical protein
LWAFWREMIMSSVIACLSLRRIYGIPKVITRNATNTVRNKQEGRRRG